MIDANKHAIKLFKAKNFDDLKNKFLSLFSKDVYQWMEKCLQKYGQETEIESYVSGGVKQDVTKDQFKKFKL